MIVLFTGSRDWTDRAAVEAAFDRFLPTLAVHGGARGLDALVDQVARARGVERRVFHADWEQFGRAAGMVRNRTMYDQTQPALVLAFPLPQSRGTWGMVRYARRQQCPQVLVWGEDV